ncbi:hypothetical protein [Sedimenticola hydrogenitrophicus]|uniref:hypothetical protein n=1 Tax=Sedimenticola hydrogenitrophicus TaxID=2967975 RepID=UPI0021A2A6D6|nr:hypothetical protein [Sedimenticola hydrogenitrophicus]
MPEQQPQGIHFLPQLPGRELGVLPLPGKPAFDRLRGLGVKPYAGMRINESLDMFPVPGAGSLRDMKQLENINIPFPKLFDFGISGLSARINRHSSGSLLYESPMENKYRTISRFLQIMREQHFSRNARDA